MKTVLIIDHESRRGEDALRLLRENGYTVEKASSETAFPGEVLPHPCNLYPDFFQNAPIGIFRSTPEGKFISVNNTTARILKYNSPDELIETVNRTNIAEALYQDTGQRREIVEDILSCEGWQTFEVQYRCKDGSVVFCRDHIRKVPGPDGVAFELVGFVEDISERKKAEEALRISQFIIDKASIGIFRGQEDGRILSANEHAARMLGYTREELCSMTFFDIVPDMGAQRWKDHRRLLHATGSRTIETVYRRKDGTTFPVEVTINYMEFGDKPFSCSFSQDISERKRVDESLRQANIVVENSPVVLFRWRADPGWPVELVSRNVTQFGYTPEELLSGGVPFSSVIHPEDLQRVAAEVRSYSAEGVNNFQQEYRIVTKGGDVRWVYDRTVFEWDAKGRVSHYNGIVMDITERKRMEESLHESEEKYRAVADFTYDWETWVDPDGRFIYVSPSCERITGYPVQDFVEDPTLMKRIVCSDDRPMVEQHYEEVIKGNIEVQHIDFRITTSNGEERWIEHICQPVFSSDGKWLGRRASNRDISERKKAEKALRESEEKFRVLAETSPTPIILIQGEKIVYANPATERLFGYSKEEFQGMRFWDWAHADFREMVRERGLARQRGEPVPSRYESRFITKTGEERWLVVSAGMIEYHGRPAGIASFLDITDIKRIEGELRDSLAEKEILLKEVHHRVKNNLQIITSLLDLQSEYIKEDESKRYIRESQARIRSMALVHEQLYKSSDLSRIDFAGYVDELVNSLQLASTLGPARVSVKVHVTDVGLNMETAIPCGLIINELVSNSLKHAFPGNREGEVLVACSQENEGTIDLTVSDNGVGLPEGLDFRNTDTMGLLIVNLLVRQLKGSIELMNRGGVSYRIRFRAGYGK